MAQPWVPTVDDLRVKMCYICREEEFHDNPPRPPVVWVHPCNCTLVAHEKCLLNWIQSSQEEPSRKKKALKCPQCSATYELESENPRLLKLLNSVNGTITFAGKVVFACGIAGTLAACGFGLYIVLTSYGAYAVHEFLGREMYGILLSDDPARWPWHAYVNLPLVPISLILSRTKYVNTLPLISLFYCWTTTSPKSPLGGSIWRPPVMDYPMQPILTWPPSPAMVTVLLPVLTRGYRSTIRRLEHWAMGIPSAQERRIDRIEVALADGGPFNVQIAANFLNDGEEEAGEAAGVQEAEAGNGQPGQQQDADAPDRDPAEAAAETVRISGSSLGRFVGGALLIPKIANFMGNVLLYLSMRSSLLRKFLAIHKPLRSHLGSLLWSPTNLYLPKGSSWDQMGQGARIGLNVLLAGTKTWAEADPVWWRNSVGLGIFIFARDCLRILHLSLTKREIETRRVKSRSFEGIDLKELDVIPPQPI